MRVRYSSDGWLEALVPVDILGPLSGFAGVRQVRPILRPQEDLGEVVSEAAELHGGTAWSLYGYWGSGVKVGIIDGGFGGITDLIGTELPTTIHARCYSLLFGAVPDDLDYCDSSFSVHGTAVAETIVDVAPDVTLYIADPYTGGDFIDAVNWMISEGVTVINQSLGFTWHGPGDGTSRFDDSILKLVDTAAANDIVWVNAAGNSGQDTWKGAFVDTDGDGFMEFSPDDETNRIEVQAYSPVVVELRWEGDWGNANTDLDLYLVRVGSDDIDVLTQQQIEGFSVDPQTGEDDHDSYELLIAYPSPIGYSSPVGGLLQPTEYQLVVKHVRGEIPDWVQLRSLLTQNLEHWTPFGSIGNPAESASDSMLAVGAAPWWNTSKIEAFSSRGPTTDGRTKPELVGADRGQTVSYASEFAGTSQSSPHVAGMVALVRDQFPTMTAREVAGYLKATAEDRGDPGEDNTWGWGFAKLPLVRSSPPFSLSDIRLTVEEQPVAGQYGHSVALDGETVVVGARFDEHLGTSMGAVYVYPVPSGDWSRGPEWGDSVKLVPPDGTDGDQFGSSIAIDGDTIVVGAPRNDRDGEDAGAAYVFTTPDGKWRSTPMNVIRLEVPSAAEDHLLGTSVAIDGSTIVVGAK